MSNSKNNKRLGVKYFLFFTLIFSLSTSLMADFTKSGDVVTDTKTGLEWQDSSESNSTLPTWQEAIDYCEVLNLGGKSDWRLPNINELKTIIDRSKTQPAIVDGFEYVGTDDFYAYWSSSTVKGYEKSTWFVYFYFGLVDVSYKDNSYYVRCVRDGQ